MKESAYIVGKYYKNDDHFQGVEEGDIYLVMKPTKENMELAIKLLHNPCD
jgi:NACalpha-BTF3-like transcription factor